MLFERHQTRAYHGIAFASAVLRVGIAEKPVDRFREQVIDVEALAIVDGFDVSGCVRFFDKAMRDKTLVPVDKVVELAAQKIAGVSGHEI